MTAPGEFIVSADWDQRISIGCPLCGWSQDATQPSPAVWPTLTSLLKAAEAHAAKHRQEAKQ